MAPLFGFYAPLSACRSQRQIEHKEFFSHSLTARTCGHRYRSRRNRSVIRIGLEALRAPQMRTSEP